MAEKVQCCVIGAGVVGLAVARALSLSGLEVFLIEKASQFGTGISSRNSEVIHAGIYYDNNSLKANLCVEGRDLLYSYCESHDVDYEKIGKVIVATNQQQVPKLKLIAEKAAMNGVSDLRYLNEHDIIEYEPVVKGNGALFSPSTGIIDTHGLMRSLLTDAEDAGAMLALKTTVKDGYYDMANDCWTINTINADDDIYSADQEFSFQSNLVINCCGLYASKLALSLGCDAGTIPLTTYAKGNYFSLTNAKTPFQHLVYPLPNEHGLGVHATLDLNHQVRFGPDVEWVDHDEDFQIDPNRSNGFYESIREYWPDLPNDSLVPSYSGIRPKILPYQDFMIQNLLRGSPTNHCQGLVNLLGIESPGLTASMAIAKRIESMVGAYRK